jgi:hypothetical protein
MFVSDINSLVTDIVVQYLRFLLTKCNHPLSVGLVFERGVRVGTMV